MKRNHWGVLRRITSWLMVVVSVVTMISGMLYTQTVTTTATETTTSATSGYETYYNEQMNKLLGEVKNYGVFADSLSVEGDFESNFAANHFSDSGHAVGNSVGKYTNAGGTCYIGKSVSGTFKTNSIISNIVLGLNYSSKANNKVNFSNGAVIDYTSNPSANIVVNPSYLNVSDELSAVSGVFENYAAKADTTGVTYNYSDMNASSIDVKSCPQGICVVSITAQQLAAIQSGGLNIKKNDGQIVIINVQGNTSVISIKEFKINSVSSTSENIEAADSVYWNLVNFTGSVSLSLACGSFVAPKATVSVDSTCRGRLIAKSVANPSGEWHFIAQDMSNTYEPLKDNFYIQKSLGGSVAGEDNTWWINFECGGTASQTINSKPLDVVFVIDSSGSMHDDSSRWNSLYSAMTKDGGLVDEILSNSNNRIATVFFGDKDKSVANAFTNNAKTVKQNVTSNQAQSGTSTYISDGVEQADQLLDYGRSDAQKVVFLLTDGVPGEYSSSDANNTSYNEACIAKHDMDTLKTNHADTGIYTVSYAMGNLQGTTYLGSSMSGTINGADGSHGSYQLINGCDSQFGVTAIRQSGNYYLPDASFAQAFLSHLATDASHCYTAGTDDIAAVFNKMMTSVTTLQKTPSDIVITDEVSDLYFKYADDLQVEYATTSNGVYGDWNSLSTSATDANYYTVTVPKSQNEGGTIQFHISYAVGETAKVRFKVKANNGVYSAATASEQNPDLPTNDLAKVTYTDVNGNAKSYTSKNPDGYGRGTNLDTPYVYIPNKEDVLSLNKYAKDNQDGTWSLNLEAYTTGTVKNVSSSKPADIVLTIDTSASMYYTMGDGYSYEQLDTTKPACYYRLGSNSDDTYGSDLSYQNCLRFYEGSWQIYTDESTWNGSLSWNDLSTSQYYGNSYTQKTYYVTRVGALKYAADNFIDSVASDCASISANTVNKHRIAITAFNGGTGTAVQDFLDVSVSGNVTALKNKISALTPGGGTYTAGGLSKACTYFQNNSLLKEDRVRADVLFTDGEPTLYKDSNKKIAGSGDSFETTGANQAISFAAKIKTDFAASVYSIGIFGGSDASDLKSNPNKFMNYVSSNYANATAMDKSGKKTDSGYYLSAGNAAELNNVFQKISSSITSSTVSLDSSAVIKDVITDTFIPAGSDADISVSTYAYLGKNASGVRTFSDTGTDITDAVKVSVLGNTVSVSGYDYDCNYVADGTDSTGQKVVTGQKIVVTIKIKRNPTTYGGNGIATNTTDSGLYDGNGNKTGTFPVPTVNVPILYGIGAQDQSIYITQETNADQLGKLVSVKTDQYGKDVDVAGQPDGTNNAYVNIMYYVKDAQGNVLKSYQLKAGCVPDNAPFDYLIKGLTSDTTYTFSAVVSSVNAATVGFAPANAVECSAAGTVHVFKPIVSCQDSTIFYGDSLSNIMDQIHKATWNCDCNTALLPATQAPDLSYTLTDMEQGTTITDLSAEPSADVNVKISAVKVGDTDITSYTTIYPAVCDAAVTHLENRDFTVHVVKGQLDITKTINDQYTKTNKINANQTFIFKINQYAVTQDGSMGNVVATYYQTIGFDANGSMVNKAATISGLKKGYYTITEETSWTPKYSLTSVIDNYAGNANQDSGVALFIGSKQTGTDNKISFYGLEQNQTYLKLASGSAALVSFTNTKKDWKYLSDAAAAVNQFVK